MGKTSVFWCVLSKNRWCFEPQSLQVTPVRSAAQEAIYCFDGKSLTMLAAPSQELAWMRKDFLNRNPSCTTSVFDESKCVENNG